MNKALKAKLTQERNKAKKELKETKRDMDFKPFIESLKCGIEGLEQEKHNLLISKSHEQVLNTLIEIKKLITDLETTTHADDCISRIDHDIAKMKTGASKLETDINEKDNSINLLKNRLQELELRIADYQKTLRIYEDTLSKAPVKSMLDKFNALKIGHRDKDKILRSLMNDVLTWLGNLKPDQNETTPKIT